MACSRLEPVLDPIVRMPVDCGRFDNRRLIAGQAIGCEGSKGRNIW